MARVSRPRLHHFLESANSVAPALKHRAMKPKLQSQNVPWPTPIPRPLNFYVVCPLLELAAWVLSTKWEHSRLLPTPPDWDSSKWGSLNSTNLLGLSLFLTSAPVAPAILSGLWAASPACLPFEGNRDLPCPILLFSYMLWYVATLEGGRRAPTLSASCHTVPDLPSLEKTYYLSRAPDSAALTLWLCTLECSSERPACRDFPMLWKEGQPREFHACG